MREIYLDNSATTRTAEPVADAVYDMLVNCYGNPSSLYRKGLEAENRMTWARREIAALIGCEGEEVTFTSGGTEANNLAVFGVMAMGRSRGKKIVTTAYEHSSVGAAVRRLAEQGVETVCVRPDGQGHIDPEEFAAAVDENTALASFMAVNNEVGSVIPVERLTRLLRRKNPRLLVHCDAVQALGKIPVQVKKWDVDLCTVTAHKIYGPKGVGALYVRRGVTLRPRQVGGEQEKRLRPGTEASALAVGFGKAAELLSGQMQEDNRRIEEISLALRHGLWLIDGIQFNSPEDAVPAVMNISVPGIRSETMMHFLEQRGISVSSGSACSKGAKSHVLTAMGLPEGRIDSALRISVGRYNTLEDAEIFCEALSQGMKALARAR
ncbi:MAG: cysteine desulfurase family protein [Oscillospiraceae bacterium]|nr:cysteine desulfurase family protein [Oscillospiraceae bacterium]